MQIARGIRAGDETSTVKEEELRPASAMEEGRIFPLRRFCRTADMLRQSIVTWASMMFRKPTTDGSSMRKGGPNGVVADAVGCEPVSVPILLKAGKSTANFAILR